MALEVRRQDYPARTDRAGYVIPAHHENYYIVNGREIARYDSKSDTIYLRTDYIGTDWSKSPYERALESPYKKDYAYLFEIFGIDSTIKMSEYTNA